MAGNNNVKAAKKSGVMNFFRGVKSEVKRITWPSKKETKKAFIAVAIFVLIYVILVGGLDFVFQNLSELILKLK